MTIILCIVFLVTPLLFSQELEVCDRFPMLDFDSTRNPFLPCIKTSSKEGVESDELAFVMNGNDNLVLLQEKGSDEGICVLSVTSVNTNRAAGENQKYSEGYLFLDANNLSVDGELLVDSNITEIYDTQQGGILFTNPNTGKVLMLSITNSRSRVELIEMIKDSGSGKWFGNVTGWLYESQQYVPEIRLSHVGVTENGLVFIGESVPTTGKDGYTLIYNAYGTDNTDYIPSSPSWTHNAGSCGGFGASLCSFALYEGPTGEELVYFIDVNVSVSVSVVSSKSGVVKIHKELFNLGTEQELKIGPLSITPANGPHYMYHSVFGYTWPSSQYWQINAYDTTTGEIVWYKETFENSVPKITVGKEGKEVYYILGRALVSLDALTGIVKWNTTLHTSASSSLEMSEIIDPGNGKIVVSLNGGGDYIGSVFEQETGKLDEQLKMLDHIDDWYSVARPVIDGNYNLFTCFQFFSNDGSNKLKCRKISIK